MTFSDKLQRAWAKNQSLLCVGLDPHPDSLPENVQYSVDGVVAFNKAIIEATKDLVCAYKPNLAFFERMDPKVGYRALSEILGAIPAELVTIADGKRGDVEYTAKAYVHAIFGELGFDAATVNPYLGTDTIEPWIENESHGAFVCCRTSNPGAGSFQDLMVEFEGEMRPLYEVVAVKTVRLDKFNNVGLVAGATWPGDIKAVRQAAPQAPILIPGVGAQKGDTKQAVRNGLDSNAAGVLVSASRSVTFASPGKDFAEAAREAARQLRDEINSYRADLLPQVSAATVHAR